MINEKIRDFRKDLKKRVWITLKQEFFFITLRGLFNELIEVLNSPFKQVNSMWLSFNEFLF